MSLKLAACVPIWGSKAYQLWDLCNTATHLRVGFCAVAEYLVHIYIRYVQHIRTQTQAGHYGTHMLYVRTVCADVCVW